MIHLLLILFSCKNFDVNEKHVRSSLSTLSMSNAIVFFSAEIIFSYPDFNIVRTRIGELSHTS